MIITTRATAVIAGAAILATVAHVNIWATGGYGTPHSYVMMAVAVGVCFASVFSVMAWYAHRRALAVCLVCCIFAGEAFNLLGTAERLIKGREVEQAPLRVAQELRAKAAKRVDAATKSLERAPTTSKRLEDAIKAKAEADKAVVDKSAERGCRENCRQLLQAQVDAAAAEIRDAQTTLDEARQKAEGELAAARTALASIKAPDSPTPLADRTGIPAWIIDLLTSALGSISANGLACCLLIFGAHHRAPRVEIITPTAAKPTTRASKGDALKQHAAEFALTCLQPGGEADLQAIRTTYRLWCPPGERRADAEIGRALAALFDGANIPVVEREGRRIVVGVSLKSVAALN
jgi:hypothetical protein